MALGVMLAGFEVAFPMLDIGVHRLISPSDSTSSSESSSSCPSSRSQ